MYVCLFAVDNTQGCMAGICYYSGNKTATKNSSHNLNKSARKQLRMPGMPAAMALFQSVPISLCSTACSSKAKEFFRGFRNCSTIEMISMH